LLLSVLLIRYSDAAAADAEERGMMFSPYRPAMLAKR